jgi:hypothetical protein
VTHPSARKLQSLGLLLLLAGCVPATGGQGPATPRPQSVAGLEAVMGRTAQALMSQFGQPDLDVREGTARKLQFSNQVCVLDTYLYPQRQGAEPVVTHVDARLPDGRDLDSASCVASLSLRGR